MELISNVSLEVINDPAEIQKANSPKGKPFLKMTFPDGRQYLMTTNVAEMIGAAGKGLRERFEEETHGRAPDLHVDPKPNG